MTEPGTAESAAPQLCPLLCLLPLSNGGCTKVDPVDWLLYSGYNWRWKKCRGGRYVFTSFPTAGRRHYVYLHRLINHTKKGFICHHRNGDTLDNRRENLQNMSPAEHDDISKLRKIAKIAVKLP